MRTILLFVGAAALAGCGDDTGAGGGGTTATSGAGSTASSGNGVTSAATTASASSVAQTSSATGVGADTWTSFGLEFVTTFCHECHGPGDPVRDYSLLATVVEESAEIRCGVAKAKPADCSGFPPPKQFPIENGAGDNPMPTDAERDRFVAWIEAGLPE